MRLNIGTSFWLIAPYAVWMALMGVLPATAMGYCLRTVATLAVLAGSAWNLIGRAGGGGTPPLPLGRGGGTPQRAAVERRPYRTTVERHPYRWGVAVGLAVFALWVWPERFEWYRRFCILGDTPVAPGQSPFDPAVCGWPLTLVRLFGSAFVIAAAEELFFRKWLVGFAGFWWMVGLFAIEHDRWLVGALAGIAYGTLYLRQGLVSAIVAHVTTNLVLGLWVIRSGNWAFW